MIFAVGHVIKAYEGVERLLRKGEFSRDRESGDVDHFHRNIRSIMGWGADA
jgi:hypothetical protein